MSEAEQLKEAGNKKFSAKDYEGAIQLYSRAISLSPENSTYYANRAAAYLAYGKVTEALNDCNSAIRIDPKYMKSYYRRAKCYLALGDYVKAEQDYKFLIEDPNNTQALEEYHYMKKVRETEERASSLLQQENYTDALKQYEILMTICPDSERSKLGFVESLIGLKQYDNALSMTTTIMKKNPSNEDALYNRALILYLQGQLPQSIYVIDKLLEYNPDKQKAFQLRKMAKKLENLKEKGNQEFKQKNFEAAITSYTEALEVDPRIASYNAVLIANRALAYKSIGKSQEAVDDLSKALEWDSTYSKAYVRRAQCYMDLNMYEEACRDYEMASLKDPENRDLKRELNEAKKLKKAAARKDYYKLLELPSKNATDYEIKRKYKELCLQWHPDKHPPEKRDEAEKKFKEIQEANSVLSDPNKRAKYDAGHDLEEIEQGGFHASDGQ
eukprot:TRINITY_DN4225_c0_g1_i1.p1 TRINITY_DN4225_c0_g1~~TRINITY_DN4225_c0_g1_i1.p1  ORF type:complete len:442 (+),score=102.67 TRINITY_DN4225_c0_g1_i1:22-1347(+)